MPTYNTRIVDAQLKRALRSTGAIHIQGPRGCGKTTTARQVSTSTITLDDDSPEATLARLEPSSAVSGSTPRLIDEWQLVPEVWNAVRHAVDARAEKGRFILTGSSWPESSGIQHSGAGRFATLTMRTTSWLERGHSNGQVSMKALLLGQELDAAHGVDVGLQDVAEWLCHGGLPGVWDDDVDVARDVAEAYVDMIVLRDLASLSTTGSRRDPTKFRRFLTGYAGLTGQLASSATLAERTADGSASALHTETTMAYHDLASRMFLVEDQPAWSTSLRGKGPLAKMPKRHLADTSLVCALLGASPERLYGEPTFFGHLFESQVVHDVRCYADAARARGVFHLRDSKGRHEIDVVVEGRDGAWVGLEVKLGASSVSEAADGLVRAVARVARPPATLAVVIPAGIVTRLPNGVWVIPATTLGP